MSKEDKISSLNKQISIISNMIKTSGCSLSYVRKREKMIYELNQILSNNE